MPMENTGLSARRSMLVIGLGNEFLADDGIGIRAVRRLEQRLDDPDIAFEELAVGGLQLLNYLVGFDRCILIDAIVTGMYPAGTILRCTQTAGGEAVHLSSSHHIDLPHVLTLGKLLGAHIPESVVVYGIEAADTTTFNDRCTDEITKAIPRLVELLHEDIRRGMNNAGSEVGQWEAVDHSATT